MSDPGHLAVVVGDHSGGPVRDVAPDHEPVTFFNEDGTVWRVVDIHTRYTNAFRVLARREKVDVNELMSAAIVNQLQRWVDERGAI